MRKANCLIVWVVVIFICVTMDVFAHGGHGGSAQLQKHNNDRTIAAQAYGGLHEDKGEVTISFYGNIAFEITSPRGVKMFIDPWRNDITGMFPPWYIRDMPIVRTDIAMVTHAHFDHDGVDRLQADMVLERMAGRFKLADVLVTGIADKHVCETQGEIVYRQLVIDFIDQDPCPPNETLQWDNSMYLIETGGLRILHWGDNRQNPPERVWEMIGDVDIAILAISDDGHILSQKWADIVMKKTKANIVIPGHYFVEGVNIPEAYGLESAAQWTAKHEHTLLDSGTITLRPEEVKKYNQHVMYFGDHVAYPTGGSLPRNPPGALPDVPEPARAWKRFAPK
ncbi:MAG: L-ascorbate metabolism protein UlaG (beta-lactamase superfamily) [Gammaproteobacteria bacterium]|jgi:L-ascorbate metabolism protein UlaG (beta-lactamase superfamily)